MYQTLSTVFFISLIQKTLFAGLNVLLIGCCFTNKKTYPRCSERTHIVVVAKLESATCEDLG